MKQFNLEFQYLLYLHRMKLDENKMHPIQKVELKRAFMAACGQMIIMMRDDFSKLKPVEAVEAYKSMQKQVLDYFLKESGRKN